MYLVWFPSTFSIRGDLGNAGWMQAALVPCKAGFGIEPSPIAALGAPLLVGVPKRSSRDLLEPPTPTVLFPPRLAKLLPTVQCSNSHFGLLARVATWGSSRPASV